MLHARHFRRFSALLAAALIATQTLSLHVHAVTRRAAERETRTPTRYGLRIDGAGNHIRPTRQSSTAAADSTLLHLPFDGNLAGADGETPNQSSGLTFEAGIKGQGVLVDGSDVLQYATAGNFNAPEGTVEFWIKPRWAGNNSANQFFFSVDGVMYVGKDAADNLGFVMRSPLDSESHQAYALGGWQTNVWHHVAVTWIIPGQMRTYVDGVERISHTASAHDLITTLPPNISVGSRDGMLQANAVIDEFRVSGSARTAAEIGEGMRDSLSQVGVSQLTMDLSLTEMFPTWRKRPTLSAQTSAGPLSISPAAPVWSSSDPAVAAVDGTGLITAGAPGETIITATLNGAQASRTLRVKTPAIPLKHETIPRFLSTPAAGSLYEVPVVVVRFLPTADGVNLDTSVNPDFHDLGPLTLEQLGRKIDTFDLRVKFMLEEGSRFRAYKNPAAQPSISYRVVDYITIYEPMPQGEVATQTNGQPVYFTDMQSVLDRIGGRHFVNDLGVKEFWVWGTGLDAGQPSYNPALHKPEYFRTMPESNMSSPVTGDVSNSFRDNKDLPVYDRTYVVYGQNFRRSQAEAVHNHGHQLEAILSYVNQRQDGNTDLFWKKFVGQDASGNFVTGRCGWTHMPPNTVGNYDYHTNYNLVESDIQDWTPAGTGQKTPVNALTWGGRLYPWPAGVGPLPTQGERNENHWYMFWMQSMPGRGNRIAHGQNHMTNWWDFTGDWDGSIRAGLGLHAPGPAPTPTPVNIDNSADFVRQHYLDFLNREPDASGLNFWTGEIEGCGANAQCREVKRINVSAAFFLSIEFQQTGYLSYRARKAAFGNLTGKPVPVTLDEMFQDMQVIGNGVVVNAGGWEQKLEQNKRAYFDQIADTQRFTSLYPQMLTPEQFVDALNANAGGTLSQGERNALVTEVRTGAKTRAQALRVVAEDEDLTRAEFNKAFVLMQFFGYLRRDPDSAPDSDFSGYNFWLGKLNEFNGNFIQAEMVKAFLDSIEYRQRFGQ